METKTIERLAIVTDEHLEFLDNLRESGTTNMIGASPFVQRKFGCTKEEARQITVYWMQSFGERHPK